MKLNSERHFKLYNFYLILKMSKFNKLSATRERLIVDIKHHFEVCETFNNATKSRCIKLRQQALESTWSLFETNTIEVEQAQTENEVIDASFCVEISTLHDKYLAIMENLYELTSDEADEFSSTRGDESHFRTNGANHSMMAMTPSIKLEPIKLKPFNGDVTQYLDFRSSCWNILTDNIPEAQRFQYLKNGLDGEPFELIKHLQPMLGSYSEAWTILNGRYLNPRKIANTLLNSLIDLPNMKEESAPAIQTMNLRLTEVLAGLRSCSIDVNGWDPILINIMSKKLDVNSARHFEESLHGEKTIPTLAKFKTFLETRHNILSSLPVVKTSTPFFRSFAKPTQKHVLYTKTYKPCSVCSNNTHRTFQCPMLVDETVERRFEIVASKALCINCLYPHSGPCGSQFTCRICQEQHHTLLHTDKKLVAVTQDKSNDNNNQTELNDDEKQANEMESMLGAAFSGHVRITAKKFVLLATALVTVVVNHQPIVLKALIDQGSTVNLISKSACERLKLRATPTNIRITGVNNALSGNANYQASCVLGSLYNAQEKIMFDALVIPSITSITPISNAIFQQWKHVQNLQLADPRTTEYSKIDILIGAATYADIILDGIHKGEPGQPIAQNTKIGWILFGPFTDTSTAQQNQSQSQCHLLQTSTAYSETIDTNDCVSCYMIQTKTNETVTLNDCVSLNSEDTLNEQIKAFWEIEEIPTEKLLNNEEKFAEQKFVQTTTRCSDGRYMVELPFLIDPFTSDCLGRSYEIALKRYLTVERKLQVNPELSKQYNECLQEYLDLNQMELAEEETQFACYLPHHPVLKPSSSTTQVRIVFDASAKTTNNFSLNERLAVGPTIQSDLMSLLVNWRKHEVAFTGDIQKMYRQIWVSPKHRDFQRILWRKPGTTKVQSYRLKTVTFGVSAAPFLAIRVLHQIGNDIKNENPILADKIQSQFYVDDYLGSCDSVENAKQEIFDLTNIFDRYGFNLRKWKSSHANVLGELEDSEKEEASLETVFKALGVNWKPTSDMFTFMPQAKKSHVNWTKRTMLSEIARIFDPLGWLSPNTIKAKVFMQKLWCLGLDWNDIVPNVIKEEWLILYNDLTTENAIQLPRWLGYSTQNSKTVELHVFCDASKAAYASAAYLRVQNNENEFVCNLIAAKTKVSPLKAITIPRLELCGALLASKLIKIITSALKLPNLKTYAWTDSTIVLAWLADNPKRRNAFVANRIEQIQANTATTKWYHIPTKENASDVASRGVGLNNLQNDTLWFHGPVFLLEENWSAKMTEQQYENDEELKGVKVHMTTKTNNPILTHFSNYERLIRFTAMCLWWLNKSKKNGPSVHFNTTEYFQKSETKWFATVQAEHFYDEIKKLTKGERVSTTSNIIALDPFIDEAGIMRVSGRLLFAKMTFDEKHPIILPYHSHLSKLIAKDAHERTFHSFTQSMLQFVRQRFWITRARTLIEKTAKECVLCFRFKKVLAKQKIAQLPTCRVQPTKPFAYTNVDFAGHFEVKNSPHRNAAYCKCYISVFVCLTTRAVHLELVHNLTSEAFILALKRFTARRGIPTYFYSDRGTNFVGASRELHKMLNQLLDQTESKLNDQLAKLRTTWKIVDTKHTHEELQASVKKTQINWRFFPAHAPHMAGSVERTVGSVKYHLVRVLHGVKISYVTFSTLLTQIEAQLNSRPLWSNTSGTHTDFVLTPSHFFNYQPINALPEPDVSEIPIERLNQYQFLVKLNNEFWRVWSKDYLHNLQKKQIWRHAEPNVHIGQIVLIAEDNIAPTHWLIGKITKTFPGQDGLIRSVELQCKKSILTRPIHKLAILPIIDNFEQTELLNARENVDASPPN